MALRHGETIPACRIFPTGLRCGFGAVGTPIRPFLAGPHRLPRPEDFLHLCEIPLTQRARHPPRPVSNPRGGTPKARSGGGLSSFSMRLRDGRCETRRTATSNKDSRTRAIARDRKRGGTNGRDPARWQRPPAALVVSGTCRRVGSPNGPVSASLPDDHWRRTAYVQTSKEKA